LILPHVCHTFRIGYFTFLRLRFTARLRLRSHRLLRCYGSAVTPFTHCVTLVTLIHVWFGPPHTRLVVTVYHIRFTLHGYLRLRTFLRCCWLLITGYYYTRLRLRYVGRLHVTLLFTRFGLPFAVGYVCGWFTFPFGLRLVHGCGSPRLRLRLVLHVHTLWLHTTVTPFLHVHVGFTRLLLRLHVTHTAPPVDLHHHGYRLVARTLPFYVAVTLLRCHTRLHCGLFRLRYAFYYTATRLRFTHVRLVTPHARSAVVGYGWIVAFTFTVYAHAHCTFTLPVWLVDYILRYGCTAYTHVCYVAFTVTVTCVYHVYVYGYTVYVVAGWLPLVYVTHVYPALLHATRLFTTLRLVGYRFVTHLHLHGLLRCVHAVVYVRYLLLRDLHYIFTVCGYRFGSFVAFLRLVTFTLRLFHVYTTRFTFSRYAPHRYAHVTTFTRCLVVTRLRYTPFVTFTRYAHVATPAFTHGFTTFTTVGYTLFTRCRLFGGWLRLVVTLVTVATLRFVYTHHRLRTLFTRLFYVDFTVVTHTYGSTLVTFTHRTTRLRWLRYVAVDFTVGFYAYTRLPAFYRFQFDSFVYVTVWLRLVVTVHTRGLVGSTGYFACVTVTTRFTGYVYVTLRWLRYLRLRSFTFGYRLRYRTHCRTHFTHYARWLVPVVTFTLRYVPSYTFTTTVTHTLVTAHLRLPHVPFTVHGLRLPFGLLHVYTLLLRVPVLQLPVPGCTHVYTRTVCTCGLRLPLRCSRVVAVYTRFAFGSRTVATFPFTPVTLLRLRGLVYVLGYTVLFYHRFTGLRTPLPPHHAVDCPAARYTHLRSRVAVPVTAHCGYRTFTTRAVTHVLVTHHHATVSHTVTRTRYGWFYRFGYTVCYTTFTLRLRTFTLHTFYGCHTRTTTALPLGYVRFDYYWF